MKKLFAFLLLFSFLASGCTFNVDVLTPASPVTDSGPSQLTPYATQNPTSPVATIAATAETTATTPIPTFSSPTFYGLFFMADPGISQDGMIFPGGIKRVFAVWNYLNMRPGMNVKREWYLNGQLWLTREETWDFAKYGENGTIQDVSIYDFDHGLPAGIYELRLYIDNVIQYIVASDNGVPEPKARFDIRSKEEAQAGFASPDFQWQVEVFGEQRIVLEDKTGNPTTIYTAREVPYLSWFADSRHFLFIDRDRSGQKSGTTIGIRDDLWLVDVPSGKLHLLYKSDTSFAGIGGPVASPNGRYIASLEGSGFADACSVDTRLIFFELSSDFDTATVIKQQAFSGLPASNEGLIYPAEQGYWQNGNAYLVTLDGTCNSDRSKLGSYTFNMVNHVATQASSSTGQSVPGDLGVGMIHGKITDAATGAPIVNAAVTCEQHSYTSASPCSGTVLTNADGTYAFNNVFFHDTDTIKITVQATGYQMQEFSWSSFTTNDFPLDLALSPTP